MNRIRMTAAITGATLLVGGAWLYRRADANEAVTYRYATLERGSIQSTVSATGTLGAVRTVQVGTQVSGQVSAIHVDFNDHVKKGQLLARIDPTLQQQAVQDAQAGLERSNAQYAAAKQEYDRNRTLFDAKIVTASEFSTVQSNYLVAQANVKSAQIALQRARQNLAYTNIYSPIDGIIVERNVDVGQTVAASLSAPQLFLIANDLSQMQILASVDESDIGSIKEGQPASFTVQSYPSQSFTGTVQQVRLQSKTTDNVVSYTAVVSVANPTGKLLPGMTATVQFTTASADSVLVVPNAALRLRPTDDMQKQVAPQLKADSIARAQARANGESGQGAPSDSMRAQWAARRAQNGGSGASGATRQRGGSTVQLWYVDAKGKLAVARVRTGLTDGTRTQVIGRTVEPGMKIIVGIDGGSATTASAKTTGTTSPFTPQRPGGAGSPRGGF